MISGATGGLGRHAVERVLALGWRVVALGRNAAVGQLLERAGAEFHSVDLAQAGPATLAPLLDGASAVWHAAALSSPWGPAQAFYRANVLATRSLLQASAAVGVPQFIHISTAALYFCYRHLYGVREEFVPPRYVNAYAASKAAAEQLVQVHSRWAPQMRTAILRPRAIFGPYDQVLLPRLRRLQRLGRGALALPRLGHTWLDLTYSGNVVDAMLQATDRPELPSGAVFNITNQQPILLREALHCLGGAAPRIVAMPYPCLRGAALLCEGAARLSGREPALTRYGAGALMYDMVLSNRCALQQLGYRPSTPLRAALAACTLEP